jgi:hypothetical protein
MNGIPRNAQNDNIENDAGPVPLSLFMDSTGKCKLSFMPPYNP